MIIMVSSQVVSRRVHLPRILLGLFFSSLAHSVSLWAQSEEPVAQVQPFTRTEQREPCTDYQINRQPLFGDLHVHTS